MPINAVIFDAAGVLLRERDPGASEFYHQFGIPDRLVATSDFRDWMKQLL